MPSTERARTASSRVAALRRAGIAAALIMLAACVELPRRRVDSLPERGYPACDESSPPASGAVAERTLRAGPVMTEQSVIETFSFGPRACHFVYTGHEEWAMGASDLEIVFDAQLRPLRAYKRSTAPGPQAPAARTDIRVFELRGPHVELTRRRPLAALERLVYRATTPAVVIATGRGALTPWIQRAHLSVGGRLRESALDIREDVEVIRDVTLRREDDRDDPLLGHVRVYTIYGREPIYTDDDDVVIGDMMGLVLGNLVERPRDPAVLTDGPPSPQHPFGE